jgi:GNAT superfamily N-acetyltransferase
VRIVSRKARPEDHDFVIGSWMSSYRRSPYAGLVSMQTWRAVMGPEIAAILGRPQIQAIVLDDVEEPTRTVNLIGHIVWQPGARPLVFFVYVKHGHRGHGFGRVLMRAAGVEPTAAFDFVCLTHVINNIAEAGKLPRATWRPLLGRSTERNEHGPEE